MPRTFRAHAPAKVNLFLGVGRLRPDGYHDVSTVLHALDFADTVRVTQADALSLVCEPSVGVAAERNIAYRAATELGHALGRVPDVAISIEKRIPHGGGLGGGSADAAAVLAILAHVWGFERTDRRVMDVAAGLGSDVAFFLGEQPALMGGRGDIVERVLPALEEPVVLVRPPLPVQTAAAYAAFDSSPQPAGDALAVVSALEAGDAAALGAALFNNLAIASASVVPAVAEVLAWLHARDGVLGATVAGSGSSVFAICADDAAAHAIARSCPERGWWGLATRLSGRGLDFAEEPAADGGAA